MLRSYAVHYNFDMKPLIRHIVYNCIKNVRPQNRIYRQAIDFPLFSVKSINWTLKQYVIIDCVLGLRVGKLFTNWIVFIHVVIGMHSSVYPDYGKRLVEC